MEVLYSLVHAIGSIDSTSSGEIVSYLKQLFQFTDAKHDELLSFARERTVKLEATVAHLAKSNLF